jgi:hypothetical protein
VCARAWRGPRSSKRLWQLHSVRAVFMQDVWGIEWGVKHRRGGAGGQDWVITRLHQCKRKVINVQILCLPEVRSAAVRYSRIACAAARWLTSQSTCATAGDRAARRPYPVILIPSRNLQARQCISSMFAPHSPTIVPYRTRRPQGRNRPHAECVCFEPTSSRASSSALRCRS